jgi:formate dehydrogenase subunit gamma
MILRYTLRERLVHWAAGAAYVYLLLTGLAFYTPKLYWLAEMLGGGAVSRQWHPWAGVAFAAAALQMYAMWAREMRITEADRVWRRAIGHYIRNEDANLPPAGRYNAGQKYLFWLMLLGGAALLVSGVAMWFTASIPWRLRFIRHAAILVHVSAALATIGGFIIHVYMGTAVVRGGFTSIVRGEVTEEWARTHHPLWKP